MNSTQQELKMAIPYLEHFLDSLETLPGDLQRNFKLMEELDTRNQELVSRVNENSDSYISHANVMSSKEKTERFKEIHEMYQKAKIISDDKVQLAMQTYEMVDKHIRRLDSELSKLESELKEKQSSSGPSLPGPSSEETGKRKGAPGGSRGQTKKGFNPKNVIKEVRSGKDDHSKIASQLPRADLPPLAALQAAVTNEVLDMPVDPNEPTYCTCHQVSYGEMIGCDNNDCPIEWFHFGCVGLTTKPKGKWYCEKCTSDRRKK